MHPERRRAPRYPVALEIGIDANSGLTLNLSSNGVYFMTEHALLPEQRVALVFPFHYAAPDGTKAACEATVLRVEQRTPGYGVAATYETISFEVPARPSAPKS